MNAGAPLLAERLRVVLALGEANAAHHRAQATAGGAMIASMAAPDGERAAADEAEHAAQTRLTQTAARVAALDAELAALDAAMIAAGRADGAGE